MGVENMVRDQATVDSLCGPGSPLSNYCVTLHGPGWARTATIRRCVGWVLKWNNGTYFVRSYDGYVDWSTLRASARVFDTKRDAVDAKAEHFKVWRDFVKVVKLVRVRKVAS